jgi:hypothetical protein
MESDLPYIDPEVLASLKAVVIVGNKTNNDSDRAIVKNLVDPDNPFVISNAAYTEGSGYADKDSPYYGAFVTDGIDDLITSTKTVQEMDITDEVTVVSMIHQIDLNSTYTIATTNYIENSNSREHVRSDVYNYGKTGIYGYSASLINNTKSDIKNILGDEADYYVKSTNSLQTIFDAKFSVVGRISELTEASQVAWYWTIIANKVLTTDQINQVIAYFNLDRTLKPDILCNTIKQGITNENHAEFGDKLIDFSGNGRDIQLNNIAWDGDSGIGKYNYPNWKVNVTQGNKYARIVYYDSINGTYSADFKGMTDLYKSYGLSVEIKVNRANTIDYHSIKEDGIYTVTPPDDTTSIDIRFGGENVYNASCDITITQIPSHAGALCLDGVNDFGQFVGDLGLKDYTLIMNRAYNNLINNQVPLVSSNIVEDQTPFIVEHWNTGSNAISFSYGASRTTDIPLDINKKIVYQSTYSYMGYVIPKGNAISTGGGITLGKFGNGVQYSAICLWSLMLFPYSMSEFLIERQLKKHKLGTLYPDMVEFRPVIKSNASYGNIVFYYKNEKVENGTYLTVGSSIGMHIRLSSSPVNEIKSITVNGIPATFKFHDANNNIYQYDFNLTSKSPQKIDITIDEYIRYEDIVQPYPLLFEFTDENGNLISWGGKAKVGNTITKTKSVSNANILAGLYNTSNHKLNGKALEGNSYVVEKSMIFTCTATYLLDNNEPKCILSPRRLRIPNSSYKILGYIPDISGHGNHGKINNSAYAGMSGVNGYPVVFGANKTWANESNGYVTSITSNTIHITNVLNAGLALLYSYVKYNGNLQNIKEIPPFKIEIKGLEGRSKFIYKYLATSDATKETNLYLGNGTHELPKSFLPTEALINNAMVGFSISPIEEGVTNFLSDITIKVLPEYEGAYCLDGVDDSVNIPTTVGGKQVLMKVNWNTINSIIYDQRGSGGFAIYCSDYNNPSDSITVPAYKGRNTAGTTYIDGIRNEYIIASQLRNVTHNIVEILDTSYAAGNINPIIGKSYMNSNYGSLALYDFMLFDNISTDDKIKQLNEYVGIEAKVELPPYYWDAYGKTNLDEDKATIQQRGVAIGDYDLINNNLAYEGMSGYNGYPAVFGTNKTYANLIPNDGNFILTSSHNIINVTKFDTSYGLLYSHIKLDGKLTSRNIDYPSYKIKVTGLGENFGLHYSYLESSSDTTVKGFEINNDGIYIIPKSFASDGSLTSNSDWIGFIFTGTAPESCNVTIEVLPEYENGLVYDGVTDYSENANIPAFTDYTYICKRTILNIPNNGATLLKGMHKVNGGAFIADYSNKWQFNFGQYNIIQGIADGINWQTVNSFNGTSINKGENTDDSGITVAKFSNGHTSMVFYKLILYPKTISLLEINFLKNLMERDEIIDFNNPIFIQE